MNPDKIQLPDFLIADLFKEGIVLIENEVTIPTQPATAPPPEKTPAKPAKPVQKTAAAASLSYLGNNGGNITMLVNEPDALHLDDAHLEVVAAMLTACKLNIAEVAIVNIARQQTNDSRLREELQPRQVILFGVTTTDIDLPFSIPDYKIQQFNNVSYLQAGALSTMTGNDTPARMEKSKLWLCLKSLFQI